MKPTESNAVPSVVALSFGPAKPDVAPVLCRWFVTPREVLMWSGERLGPVLTPERLAEHMTTLAGDDAHAIGAWTAAGGLVGYSELRKLEGDELRVRLSRVGVAPEMRGQGIGRALVEHLVAIAFEEYMASVVELTALAVNATAIDLYSRVGFRVVEVRRGACTGHDGAIHDLVDMSLPAPGRES